MLDQEKPEADRKHNPQTHYQPRRLAAHISTALMLGFGLLVFLAVAGVLLVGMWSAQRNTVDLLSDKADLALNTLVDRLRSHLDPVAESNAFLAGLMAEGEVDPGNYVQLVDYMTAAMAATPQVRSMGFIDANLMITRAVRSSGRVTIRLSDWSGNRDIAVIMEKARVAPRPYWGELFWAEEAKTTLLNRRAPLWRNGEFLGVLTTVVSVADLSRYIARQTFTDFGATRFILYGDDHVLAHRAMIQGGYALSDSHPLPTLRQIDDPVLTHIGNNGAYKPLRLSLGANTGGRQVKVGDDAYVVLFRRIEGYGPVPLRVGAYIKRSAAVVGQEMNRLVISGVVGLVILLISVSAALFLGRVIAQPVRVLAQAAHDVRGLDLAKVPHLERSRLHELDEASVAFNSMITGLKWFETYVPRRLVHYVLERGEDARIASEERTVTVLFTDIHAFTGFAQDKTASETAAFLNGHFSLVAGCIEDEHGTVDKYMGDSVMAFWGAPVEYADGAARACRAALAIRRAIFLDNESRTARGEQPIQMRVGIHTGPAVVGNIGAPGRINYTLVGDTVNIAQRLQQLGKELGTGEDVEILVSGDVVERIGDDFHLMPQGSQTILGRHGVLSVYRLR